MKTNLNSSKSKRMKNTARKDVERMFRAEASNSVSSNPNNNYKENNDTKMNYTGPDRETVIRTVSLILVLINQVIVLCGREALPFTEDQMYAGISAAATVVVSLWTWWKNNSFTTAACAGDQIKDKIRNKELK